MYRELIRRALSSGLKTLAGLGCIIAVALAQQTATIERGEVLAVNGNDIIVKMDTGEVRHYTAPPGATAMVDGKQITVHDLRPGMKLQRTTITTTTERPVRSVRTVQRNSVASQCSPCNLHGYRREEQTGESAGGH